MATTENTNQLDRPRERKKIRKEFVYALDWPSERDVAEPVYSESNQAIELALPGIIIGGAIHGLILFLIHNVGFAYQLELDMFIFFGVIATGFSLCISVIMASTIYLATFFLSAIIQHIMSPRRVILVAGGASLIPISLIYAAMLAGEFGIFAFVICVVPGIWMGAYATAWVAASAGKWTYTDQPHKSYDLLQFKIRDMLWATTFFAVVVLIDQSFPGYFFLAIVGLIIANFFLLFVFDRQWMKYQGQF